MNQQYIYMAMLFVSVFGLVFVVFTGLNMRRAKDDRRLADEEVELGGCDHRHRLQQAVVGEPRFATGLVLRQ